jgi:hypothetical protein
MNRPAWLLTAASMMIAVPAAGQSVYVGAGPSFPTSDYGDYADTGFLIVGGLTYQIASQLSVYGEGFWGQNDHETEGDKTNPAGAMAGLAYGFLEGTGAAISPYVFGGAGVMFHRYSSDTFGDSSESAFGYQVGAGAGMEVGGVTVFGEGRYMAASFDSESEGADSTTAFFAAVLGLSFNLFGR